VLILAQRPNYFFNLEDLFLKFAKSLKAFAPMFKLRSPFKNSIEEQKSFNDPKQL